MRNMNTKSGFSLVELLISLIVISCITAAFTPLITKKFSSSVFRGGSVSDITSECSKFGENCNLCTSNFCLSCKLTCGADEYKDEKSCTCKKCSDKYGQSCTSCNFEKCLTCPYGQYLDENDNCKSCVDKFENCTSCNKDECLSCDSGYILTKAGSIKTCSEFNCSSPDFIQIGSLCITKKNMGDGDSLIIPNGVNIVSVNQTCNPSLSNYCCWQGQTAGSCDNENGGIYSGCTRTVCDNYAANYICNNFNASNYIWRLAAKDELDTWIDISKSKGVNGLQLCDSASGKSSAQCSGINSCLGADGDCLAYKIWSSEFYSNSISYNYYLTNGNWTREYSDNTSAYSVRCVTEMNNSCEDKNTKGCLICDGDNCLSCDSGFYLKNGKCEIDCISRYGENCTGCDLNQCTSCADGYTLSGGSCKPICNVKYGENCKTCNETSCTACVSGYYPNGATCKTCKSKYGANCKTCNANKCSTCKSGYTLYAWGCANSSCNGMEGCLECEPKPSSGVAGVIPGVGSGPSCTSCASGYTLGGSSNVLCSAVGAGVFYCPKYCTKN